MAAILASALISSTAWRLRARGLVSRILEQKSNDAMGRDGGSSKIPDCCSIISVGPQVLGVSM